MHSHLRIFERTLRLAFLALFLGVLIAGLNWALNPGPQQRFDRLPSPLFSPSATPAVSASAPPPASAEASTVPTAAATPEPTPSPTPTVSADVLIAAAKPPSATSVQVLDASGGPSNVAAAVQALEALGYRVSNVTAARVEVAVTTVWFTTGSESAALALRARDPRFAEVEPNQALSEGIDIHVLVGPDF